MHYGYQGFGATPAKITFTPAAQTCVQQMRAAGASPTEALQTCIGGGGGGGVPWYAWAGLGLVAVGAGWFFFLRPRTSA